MLIRSLQTHIRIILPPNLHTLTPTPQHTPASPAIKPNIHCICSFPPFSFSLERGRDKVLDWTVPPPLRACLLEDSEDVFHG
jgi:hypothetical protein